MKKFLTLALTAVMALSLLTACGSKTETANDVDLTGFYNALAEQYGWGDDMMDLDGEMLEMYYPGLGDIPAKQLLAKAPVMSYAVSEYVFLQADSEQDAAQAVKILQTRIDEVLDHLVDGVLVGDVADIAVGLDTGLLVGSQALIDQLLLDVVEDDGSAVCGHCLCDSHADAVRCAGDERDLAGQVKGFGSTLCHN